MKKRFAAALAAVLAMSMVFPSLALTKLATPEVRWNSDQEALPEWTRIEDASGEYQVEAYKDGTRMYNMHHIHPVTNTSEYLRAGGFINDLETSGIYKFRVMALGDGINTEDSDWSSYSDDWDFQKSSVSFGTPTNLHWDGTVTCWDAPEIPEQYAQYLDGYEVSLIGDGYVLVTHNSVGKNTCSFDNAEFMDDEDVKEYTFSVRAISNTPSVIFHGDMAYSDGSYDAEENAGSVSEVLDELLEGSTAIETAPDTLSAKIQDVQVAMQTDENVLGQVAQLEQAYKEAKGLDLDISVSPEAEIDPSDVSVIGALLNAEDGSSTVTFNISKPAREEVVDAAAYRNSIQFDFHLDGAVSTLKVPVRITVPIPAGINPYFFRILHYHDGNLEEVIIPTINAENRSASFTVTSFSTFVFAEQNVETPSNATEFFDLAATLPDPDPFNPFYNPLSDLNGEEKEDALSAVAKLVEALEKNSRIGDALMDEEDIVYKLSAILYHLGGADCYPQYDYDGASVMYHSLAFAPDFFGKDEGPELSVEIATSSNASNHLTIDLQVYRNGLRERSLRSPMKFVIPVPEGFTYPSNAKITGINSSKISVVYDEENDLIIIYTLKASPFTITSAASSSSSGSGSKGKSSTPPIQKSPAGGRWTKTGDTYSYFYSDGTRASNCWLEITWNNTTHWYYFDSQGIMATGWFKDNRGNWYYLNPTADGVYGSMVTGWNRIDGKWYYFNEKSDGFKGTMLYSTTTPDGYSLGADGVWTE